MGNRDSDAANSNSRLLVAALVAFLGGGATTGGLTWSFRGEPAPTPKAASQLTEELTPLSRFAADVAITRAKVEANGTAIRKNGEVLDGIKQELARRGQRISALEKKAEDIEGRVRVLERRR